MKTRMLGALALGLITAACGVNQQDRVGGGAAAGAATGAGVGALAGPPGVLAGAAIGAGAGAATGAATEPSTLNLGEPPWSNPDARVPGTQMGSNARSSGSSSYRGSGMASSDTRALQRALNNRGYDAGPADGVYGPRTRQAVMDWQRANNMQATGRPSQQMAASLGLGSSATGQTDPNRAYMGGGMTTSQAGDSRPRDAAGHPIGSAGPGIPPGAQIQTGAGSSTARPASGAAAPGATRMDSAGRPVDAAGNVIGSTPPGQPPGSEIQTGAAGSTPRPASGAGMTGTTRTDSAGRPVDAAGNVIGSTPPGQPPGSEVQTGDPARR
ncbi:peptidoglycan-binding protein [Roseomonas sp. AR75]|uniref:peptidoglycan-binding domain-containing protein n=1 Tax=Roseomonas sp. AR75 TaxID=2562311 RepID=UPI0010BFB663|nr:peptidoglycan-binding protein [Roseomonas sp. AR75]